MKNVSMNFGTFDMLYDIHTCYVRFPNCFTLIYVIHNKVPFSLVFIGGVSSGISPKSNL
jgi:hypothetical protein